MYLVHGMHHWVNIVTEAASHPAAALVRAVEPVAGVEVMRAARGRRARRGMCLGIVPDARLAAGPGLVAGSASVSGPAASRRAPALVAPNR